MQREAGAAWWWLLGLLSAWLGGQLPELPGSIQEVQALACLLSDNSCGGG